MCGLEEGPRARFTFFCSLYLFSAEQGRQIEKDTEFLSQTIDFKSYVEVNSCDTRHFHNEFALFLIVLVTLLFSGC